MANVDTVLRGLRDHDKLKYLWIDAICFNQSDELEKAQQIPLMGDIYKTAAAVDIWLAPANDMTRRVLRFFRKLSRLPDVTKWRSQWQMAKRITFLMKKFIHYDVRIALHKVYDFFHQPWFSRRWIIQEVCLARHGTVHCGEHSIDLQSLSQAAMSFQRMDMSDHAIKVAANLRHHTTELDMLELLWHFHESRCLEPKDRIAAFLGITQGVHKPYLDYTKPWDEIFRDFAISSYSLGNNDTRLQLLLHLFEFGSVSKQGDPSYPSWVPDWSSPRQRRLPYISGPKNLDTYELYPKSPGHSRKATVNFPSGRLQLNESRTGTGLQSLRTASLVKLRYLQCAETSKAQQVCDVIERLFLNDPNAHLHTIALAVLLRTVSRFRHSDMERKKRSKCLGEMEKVLANRIGPHDCEELLTWLRTLDSVLHDFFLLELKSFSHDRMPTKGYGIGLRPVQDDDITVPLWSLQTDDPESSLPMSASGTNFRLSTMLVVRRNSEKVKGVLDSTGQSQECKIVGPAICITWTSACNEGKRLVEHERCHSLDCTCGGAIRIN